MKTTDTDAADLGYVDGCYINDHTRGEVVQVKRVMWHWNMDTKRIEYALILGTAFTHYLTIDQLCEIYPCLGSNESAIKTLYGSNK